MSPAGRLWLFLPGAAGLAALFGWGVLGLPPLGHYRGPYGDAVNAATVPERHITDAVTAVNFDFRGFDTLGEEYILFASVMGAALLLRKHPEEIKGREHDKARGRHIAPASDAVRIFGMAFIPPVVLFGIYIVTHGQLTPGGGFQGGVILATGALLIYLGGDFRKFRRLAPHGIVETAEAVGAAGYALVGIAGLIAGLPFLTNVLPLGKTGDIFSGGTVAVIDLAVGMEVGAGFLLLMFIYLQEVLMLRPR